MFKIDANVNIISFDVSSTGELYAFGDASGLVREWANKSDAKINRNSNPVEPLDFEIPHNVQMDEDTYVYFTFFFSTGWELKH